MLFSRGRTKTIIPARQLILPPLNVSNFVVKIRHIISNLERERAKERKREVEPLPAHSSFGA